jgi:hypothetical protein
VQGGHAVQRGAPVDAVALGRVDICCPGIPVAGGHACVCAAWGMVISSVFVVDQVNVLGERDILLGRFVAQSDGQATSESHQAVHRMLQARKTFGTTASRHRIGERVHLFHDRCMVILAYPRQVWLLPNVKSAILRYRGRMTSSSWAWSKRHRWASACGGGGMVWWRHDQNRDWYVENKLDSNF